MSNLFLFSSHNVPISQLKISTWENMDLAGAFLKLLKNTKSFLAAAKFIFSNR